MLIWMTGALESSELTTENNINIFFKLLQIYNLIWNQLGSSKKATTTNDSNESAPTPIAFLNQMYVLNGMFLQGLTSMENKLAELKSNEPDQNEFKISKRVEMENFFAVRKELIESFKFFEFNLVQFEVKENLEKQLKGLLDMEIDNVEFDNVLDLIESKKRKCSDHSGSNKKIKN